MSTENIAKRMQQLALQQLRDAMKITGEEVATGSKCADDRGN